MATLSTGAGASADWTPAAKPFFACGLTFEDAGGQDALHSARGTGMPKTAPPTKRWAFCRAETEPVVAARWRVTFRWCYHGVTRWESAP